MPKTKLRKPRRVLLGKCRVCQGNFETTTKAAKTCSNACRQGLHRRELAKRLTTYAITTDEELKAGIVEVLPRMATRYGFRRAGNGLILTGLRSRNARRI